MEAAIKGNMPAKTGRRAMQRVSTLPNVHGFMMSEETYQVAHYAEGKRVRLFDPSRRSKSDKGVIIQGEDGGEIAIPYEKYEF